MAEVIVAHTEDGDQEVTLADISAILSESTVDYPVVTAQGGLVFRVITDVDDQRLKEEFSEFLQGYYYPNMAKMQKLLEKPEADRTEEDKKFLATFEINSWPYSIALAHAMLHLPEWDRLTFEKFMKLLSQEDRSQVFEKCKELIGKKVIDPGN